MTTARPRGVLAPVVTPFDERLEPDVRSWIAHCRWLLSQDCGLAIFGTNSEANSLSADERLRLLDAAFEAGLDPARMMPGTGACSLPETVGLTRRAVEGGAAGVLMLPPFYYKGVSDDGLFTFYSEVVQRVGDPRLRLYLYHIPSIAQIPIGPDLIERLLKAYPGTVAGLKDSSGDFDNTRAMLERFDDFDVFCGSEAFLLDTLRAGGAGCISATANLNPGAIATVYARRDAADATERQSAVTEFRRAIEDFPMIPALKATIGLCVGDEGWRRVRPPLVALDEGRARSLAAALGRLGFEMPGRGTIA